MDVRVEPYRRLSAEELMLLNCGGLRRLLRVPWTAGRSKQSILKEISPEYSLEGLMLKLILQYFGHLMWRNDSLAKTLMLGKIEGKRRRGQQRMRWLDSITNLMDMSLGRLQAIGDGQGSLVCCSQWGRKESDMTERLNWTDSEQESLRRNGIALIVNRRVWNAVLVCNLKNDRMISVRF